MPIQSGSEPLLQRPAFRRLLLAMLCGSLGHQFAVLALPLTAAVLLQASPWQMGLLTALELLPFALFSLPAGVWLDRVRKLPVYIGGELMATLAMASVPLLWWLDRLHIGWLYGVAFAIGTITTTAGSAAQVVFTQVVPRERLVEAHSRASLAESGADVAGPGLAGALFKLASAPVALLVSAMLNLTAALVLVGLTKEAPPAATPPGRFMADLRDGLRFVWHHRLLAPLVLLMAGWQACMNLALVVQILVATRVLEMPSAVVGAAYMALGVGTVAGSLLGDRITRWLGCGPTFAMGLALCGAGWLIGALARPGEWAELWFGAMLLAFGLGATLLYINFLAMRQAVTPPKLLGRMTASVRWLTLLPAVPAALLGGWLGEHWHLQAPLMLAGGLGLLLALVAWRLPAIGGLKTLPSGDPPGPLGPIDPPRAAKAV